MFPSDLMMPQRSLGISLPDFHLLSSKKYQSSRLKKISLHWAGSRKMEYAPRCKKACRKK